MRKVRRHAKIHDDILCHHYEFECPRYEAGKVGHTMGSVGMGRLLISVALSEPSPAAFSPHETVSLTIQSI